MCPKMRKIRITEAQLKTILEQECGYPLNMKGDDGKPDIFMGDEVAVNNIDKDAPNDVTISDTMSKNRSKAGWFGMNRWPAMHRLPEGEELDDKQTSGFGEKSDNFIHDVANSGGGKMAANVSNEINSDTRGTRNNTNQVRISRMERDKAANPENFQKNGGDKMLKILKNQVKKNSATNKNLHASEKKTINPDSTKPNTGGIIYFK